MRPDSEVHVEIVAKPESFGDWEGLQTRIELVGNHRTFVALAFEKVGETCHPGCTRTTRVTFRKILNG